MYGHNRHAGYSSSSSDIDSDYSGSSEDEDDDDTAVTTVTINGKRITTVKFNIPGDFWEIQSIILGRERFSFSFR